MYIYCFTPLFWTKGILQIFVLSFPEPELLLTKCIVFPFVFPNSSLSINSVLNVKVDKAGGYETGNLLFIILSNFLKKKSAPCFFYFYCLLNPFVGNKEMRGKKVFKPTIRYYFIITNCLFTFK